MLPHDAISRKVSLCHEVHTKLFLFRPQDMGVRSVEAAHKMLGAGDIYMEARTGAAQTEGNIHDMHSFEKVRW